MTRRPAVACLLLVFVAACEQLQPQEAHTPGAAAREFRFDCGEFQVTARFPPERVELRLADRTLTLPQARSGSGARYTDGRTTFWNKGNEAAFDLEGRSYNCRVVRDPWQEARDRGVEFRALGQEPGWYLEIDVEEEILFVYDYMQGRVVTPVPGRQSENGVVTYEARTEAHTLRVVIENRACSDAMSGQPFPNTVTVTLDGRAFHGCGRAL